MIVRLKFEKYGPIRFVGHLDIMRYFQKVMRRAKVDIKFSEGYSPHMLMRFAHPLPVGATGEGEYLDITMNGDDVDAKAVMNDINAVCHEGIRILDAKVLPEGAENAMSAVKANAFKITFRDPVFSFDELEEKLDSFLALDRIETMKKTKKGMKTMDIRPFIYRAGVVPDGPSLYLLLAAGSENNIKPVLFTETFLKHHGYEAAENDLKASARLKIHHVETYTDEGEGLTPLI